MSKKLTEAQRWALAAIRDGHNLSPSTLGARMMERPGVEERRRGGNRNSPQGLGRVGGMMMARLHKLGLVVLDSGTTEYWHATQARLTPAGRAVLEHGGEKKT